MTDAERWQAFAARLVLARRDAGFRHRQLTSPTFLDTQCIARIYADEIAQAADEIYDGSHLDEAADRLAEKEDDDA